MWIVRLALERPYTFVVSAILVVIVGVLSIVRMPTDIFPEINIPVISVIFNYSGMSPEDMEKRVVGNFERFLTTTVNDIEHIESQSLYGIGLLKIFFQKDAKIEAATAQVTAVSQTAIRQMPPGTQPPLIIRYSASSVPIIQLSLSSKTLPEQQLFDLAINTLRPQLITIPGVQLPYPYGGKQRQIMVDLDPEKMYAWNISPADLSTAINNQNVILPAGTTKIGTQEYQVRLNSSPETVAALNDLPIKVVRGIPITVKDIAQVRDGFSVQTNMVHSNGNRGVLLSVLKNGNASTLDVVDAVKEALPRIKQTLPETLDITPLFDQSLFVRASIKGVIHEALIAAGLTALMILLFLGSWRSTLIVVISIPLSILVSIIFLSLIGHTLNVMTLGGMALAVGILVDDATVEIENIHRNLHQKKRLVRAILDGAQQIAVPAFVSTACICIVFIPVFFVSGAAKYLFTPLALAVVFAMMTSYFLSRTLVPTMVHYLLAQEVTLYGGEPEEGQKEASSQKSLIWKVHEKFNRQFERLQRAYGSLLLWGLGNKAKVFFFFSILVGLSSALFPFLGTDFFPTVDAGQLRLHVRAPAGTRIEETERYFARIAELVKSIIPEEERSVLLDNLGIPNSGINLSLSEGTMVSPADGELLVSLRPHHRPTAEYVREIRLALAQHFPEATYFFSPADIATQVLNFGLPAPIDIQLSGPGANQKKNLEVAQKILREAQSIPGAVDVRLAQVPYTPDLRVNVDRVLAGKVGLTQREVASDLLISLSSSTQTAPNFWLNPQTGVNYSILVQTPQYRIGSLESLGNTPVVSRQGSMRAEPQLLSNLATFGRSAGPTNITHYNITPTYDVLLGVQGTDLGSVATKVRELVAKHTPELPRGSFIRLRGQIESMATSFTNLAFGLIFAILLVYFLMVINFQSWLDPFIILTALPTALSGIIWMLYATKTTISVPSLMGSIMCIGVATSNSILMVTFANDRRKEGDDASRAALLAGITRLRPVLMTALAMIIGMLPMALGLGEGGEQNAPLGRAVIGGLLMATLGTLLFVPVTYAILRQQPPRKEEEIL